MKTGYLEILLTLISAWAVYGVCQADPLLPVIGTAIVLVSFISRMRKDPGEDANLELERKIRWLNPIGISLLLGWAWRTFLSGEGDFSPIGILQSALVFLSVLIWFRYRYYYRSYVLRFLSWTIVALSINVPFDLPAYVTFWIFCLLNTVLIFLKSHISTDTGRKKKPVFKKILSPSLYFIGMVTICFGLFSVLVYFVKVGDQAFMLFIKDYFLYKRHHLLDFGPTLDLRSPGYSGRNIRPIMEVDRNDNDSFYLAAQILEHYDNGKWNEAPSANRHPVSNALAAEKENINLILFDHFKGIIPAPAHVASVKSHDLIFEQDENGIIHSADVNALKMSFSLNKETAPVSLSEERKRALTELSPFLKKNLAPLADQIIRRDEDPVKIAKAIENYFKNNFEYTLDVYFGANEQGLLTMLTEKHPAYCSYFASAMIMLLRERGVPARLKIGFYANEPVNEDKQFLVRVRDAHAWVEVLLPVDSARHPDPESSAGEGSHDTSLYRWTDFDPTPGISRLAAINTGEPINPLTDWLWRSQRRLRTEFLNMDSTKILVRLLLLVLVIIVLKNPKEIIDAIKNIRLFRRSAEAPEDETTAACRQIYQSFEDLLHSAFALTRDPTQTDEELVLQLREEKLTSEETISFIKSFLNKYHDVRFGKKMSDTLEDYLKAIEGNIKKHTANTS